MLAKPSSSLSPKKQQVIIVIESWVVMYDEIWKLMPLCLSSVFSRWKHNTEYDQLTFSNKQSPKSTFNERYKISKIQQNEKHARLAENNITSP